MGYNGICIASSDSAGRLQAERRDLTLWGRMEQVEAFCGKWDMLPRGGLVLCAVSGGRDSMCLLHLLRALAAGGGFQVAAAHFNHRLRPGADRDEALVRDWCREQGILLEVGRGDVRAFARETGKGLEDAARTLRYRFLEEAADRLGAARIATAHHLQDSAETVLLNLLRGAGLRGLGGIPPVRGRIIRPLLETGRAEINRYLEENAIPFAEDETNADPAYTRNRLRLEVLPLLEDISPGCTGRMAGTGALLREEEEHLRQEAEASASMRCRADAVTVSGVWREDAVIGRRLIRSAARRLGAELDRRSTENVWRLSGGGYLNLPGGLCALRTGESLTVRRQPPSPPPLPLREGEQVWGPWRVTVQKRSSPPPEEPDAVLLRDTGRPLTIASWDGRGRLGVANGSRTIKRLFADAGIPVDRRWEHPAVLLEGRPAAILGVAVDWSLRPREGERCWVVEVVHSFS